MPFSVVRQSLLGLISNNNNQIDVTSFSTGRTCYFDCFSGVSGDMLLAALLHAGVDRSVLLSELKKLHLDGLDFQVNEKKVNSISGLKVDIDSEKRQDLRTLPTIVELISRSGLEPNIINRATEVFTVLARAEAKVHGISVDKVHFHEVGALDTIVDIVGVLICLSLLKVSRVVCSSLPTGSGFVNCDHGLLPLPAPAVCELLQDVPTYGVELRQELITPTGAALIKVLADSFGPLPPMIIKTSGYGAGSHVLENGQPNLLRCIIGTSEEVVESQKVEIIETNLDDWSPEGFPYISELLFQSGALDVSLHPIQMKKGRPGFTLQVISTAPYSQKLKEIIFSETTSIGLRFRQENRATLVREKVSVSTKWGNVTAKQVRSSNSITIYPEYEECRKIAILHNVPLKQVYQEVQRYGNRNK